MIHNAPEGRKLSSDVQVLVDAARAVMDQGLDKLPRTADRNALHRLKDELTGFLDLGRFGSGNLEEMTGLLNELAWPYRLVPIPMRELPPELLNFGQRTIITEKAQPLQEGEYAGEPTRLADILKNMRRPGGQLNRLESLSGVPIGTRPDIWLTNEPEEQRRQPPSHSPETPPATE